MKLDKTTETILIFLAALVIIVTGLFVQRQASNNKVVDTYEKNLSLVGSRLTDKVYASVERSNQWDEKTGLSTKLVFKLHNSSSSMIKNWTAVLKLPEGAELTDSWNIAADMRDGNLVFNPLSEDMSLDPGEATEFGVVLRTNELFHPTEISFYGYNAYTSGTSFFEQLIYLLFICWAILFIGFFVTRFNFKNYREKQKNDVRIILQSMNTFIRFIDAKDPYTRGHSTRVAMYAAEIAKRMHLSEDEVQNVYYAGLLHDAGKISIPDAVLNKPGKLSDEERKQIQDHTVAGGKMLKQLTALRGIRETALYHHERYDGKGYPEGLKREAIPLYARIVGVADSYDAMSSNRVYRRHLNKDEIIEEIQKGSGSQFDPEIVVYMVDMINDGYVNVVKMETAETEEGKKDFHITEEDIPGVYMGL